MLLSDEHSLKAYFPINSIESGIFMHERFEHIKKALSKSYCIKPKSIMKHPPYTGTMTIYCDNETFVYEIYGNTFVSGDNIHYMAPINLSWSIKSFGE